VSIIVDGGLNILKRSASTSVIILVDGGLTILSLKNVHENTCGIGMVNTVVERICSVKR